MTKITLIMLKRAGACEEQVQEFERRYGQETTVTVDACLAVACVFNWHWAASHLLSDEALAAYKAVERPALVAYEAAERPAWEAYMDVQRPAMEAYMAVWRPAMEAYRAEQAKAFAEAFMSMSTYIARDKVREEIAKDGGAGWA